MLQVNEGLSRSDFILERIDLRRNQEVSPERDVITMLRRDDSNFKDSCLHERKNLLFTCQIPDSLKFSILLLPQGIKTPRWVSFFDLTTVDDPGGEFASRQILDS